MLYSHTIKVITLRPCFTDSALDLIFFFFLNPLLFFLSFFWVFWHLEHFRLRNSLLFYLQSITFNLFFEIQLENWSFFNISAIYSFHTWLKQKLVPSTFWREISLAKSISVLDIFSIFHNTTGDSVIKFSSFLSFLQTPIEFFSLTFKPSLTVFKKASYTLWVSLRLFPLLPIPGSPRWCHMF